MLYFICKHMARLRNRSYYLGKLGLDSNANDAQIKIAYRDLAKKHHPDINPTEAAHQSFIDLNEAYSILLNWDSMKVAKEPTSVDWTQALREERIRLKAEAKQKAKEAYYRYLNTQIKINAIISPVLYLGILYNILIFLDHLLPPTNSNLTISEVVLYDTLSLTTLPGPSSDSYAYVYTASHMAIFEVNDRGALGFKAKDSVIVESTPLFGKIKGVSLPKETKDQEIPVSFYYMKYLYLNLIIIILGMLYVRMSKKATYKLHVAIGLLLTMCVQYLAILEIYTL